MERQDIDGGGLPPDSSTAEGRRGSVDALLIGALYGELTPAEDAQLTAHLAAHPADRQALEDLTAARTAVRDSRYLATLLDPPQAVSALLLQEAARRAPRVVRSADVTEGDGWFARLRRSFMAHPAMAAAAMLVVVVGVAGSMYLRNGSKGFSDVEVSNERIAAATAATAATTTDQSAPGGAPAAANANLAFGTGATGAAVDHLAAAGSGAGVAINGAPATPPVGATEGYSAGLADPDSVGAAQSQQRPAQGQTLAGDGFYKTQRELGGEVAQRAQKADDFDGTLATAPTTAYATTPSNAPAHAVSPSRHGVPAPYVVVAGNQPMVKDEPPADMPVAKLKAAKPQSPAYSGADALEDSGERKDEHTLDRSRSGAGGGAGSTIAATPTASPPPPPAVVAPKPSAPPAKSAQKKAASDDGKDAVAQDKSAVNDEQAKKDATTLAWAKDQHARLRSLIQAGKCTDAAPIAAAIANRAPDYYAEFIANARDVKQCLPYIQDATDKEAAHSSKARVKNVVSPAEAQPAPAADSK